MSNIDLTRWTCDRCAESTEEPTHNEQGERNGPPNGWRRLAVGHEINADVCDSCAAAVLRWWQGRPFGPAT